ncbi:MAG: nuclear transport factor 2 family protein [Anaerolineales bacterium]|nr:nuclear transport factor 2 family protein [Anaerolineales bacterium]
MTQPTSTEMIHSARERFNSAIATKDADIIKTLLAPNYHLITGRSAQFHGAEEEGIRWSELFHADPTAVYRRTPREVTANESWGIAQEIGSWQGSYTAEGILVHASGVYAAKWQRTKNGQWVLQAEVFTTLVCEGPCDPPDPI